MKIPPNRFLLIAPSDGVIECATSLKQHVRKLIGHTYESFYSKPHVTLFQYHDFHNDSQLYNYEERISCIKPFYVHVEGVKAFYNNRTIFLDLKYFHDVCTLVEQLGRSINHPHITIAKNLPPKDFDLALQDLQKFPYSNRFVCDHVTVLKWINTKWNFHTDLLLK